jgi:hypothetical protein
MLPRRFRFFVGGRVLNARLGISVSPWSGFDQLEPVPSPASGLMR